MSKSNQEQYYEDTLYGSYADVLFILFPFLVIAMLRTWNEEGSQILQQPDLSIAASILAGMSLGKFVLGLIGNADLVRYKERIVFFIALTIFLVLGPSVMIIIKITNDNSAVRFVAYVQPILLTIAIALYATSVRVQKVITQKNIAAQTSGFNYTRPEIAPALNIAAEPTTNNTDPVQNPSPAMAPAIQPAQMAPTQTPSEAMPGVMPSENNTQVTSNQNISMQANPEQPAATTPTSPQAVPQNNQ